jgi:hypothetical protein
VADKASAAQGAEVINEYAHGLVPLGEVAHRRLYSVRQGYRVTSVAQAMPV